MSIRHLLRHQSRRQFHTAIMTTVMLRRLAYARQEHQNVDASFLLMKTFYISFHRIRLSSNLSTYSDSLRDSLS
jgi:hypothetical protein